jgi:hypothetical protein
MHDMANAIQNGLDPETAKFKKGHRISVANRGNRSVRTFRNQLVNSTTFEQVKEVIDEVLKVAREDRKVSAYKLWLEYVVGRSPVALEIGGPDGEPLAIKMVTAIMMAFGDDSVSRSKVARAVRQIELMANDDHGFASEESSDDT